MEKSNLPIHFQQLETLPYIESEGDLQVRVIAYQTNHFFPHSFYKPILSYIGPRYFKQEHER